MSTEARLALEDLLVARGRLARIDAAYPQRRTFGPGKPIPIVVAHYKCRAELEAAYAAAGGDGAVEDAERVSATQVARSRLKGDKRAGRCLCNLPLCAA